jgi:hypothetical protein
MDHKEYTQFIKDHGGQPLYERLGVDEWAFRREDALKMLESMKKKRIPCSGGDVIIEDNEGKLKYVNDNWYYQYNKHGEDQEQYIDKSIVKAEEYIKNYPEKDNQKYFYILV